MSLENKGIKRPLLLHSSVKKKNFDVFFTYQLSKQYFALQFDVTKRDDTSWIIPPPKTFDLWNYDVVEIFLQWRQNKDDVQAPYFEFELCPDGQQLGLIIFRPRLSAASLWNYTFTSQIQLENNQWNCQMTIPWPSLPNIAETGILYGGAFSCLGSGHSRNYFSTNPNSQERPDFHRPELFIPL